MSNEKISDPGRPCPLSPALSPALRRRGGGRSFYFEGLTRCSSIHSIGLGLDPRSHASVPMHGGVVTTGGYGHTMFLVVPAGQAPAFAGPGVSPINGTHVLRNVHSWTKTCLQVCWGMQTSPAGQSAVAPQGFRLFTMPGGLGALVGFTQTP